MADESDKALADAVTYGLSRVGKPGVAWNLLLLSLANCLSALILRSRDSTSDLACARSTDLWRQAIVLGHRHKEQLSQSRGPFALQAHIAEDGS